MQRRIATSSLQRDPSAFAILDCLEAAETELGLIEPIFYYDFPLFRDESNRLYRSKVLIATRDRGLFLLLPLPLGGALSTEALTEKDQELAQLDSLLFSKLLRSSVLRSSPRSLRFPMTTALSCIGGSMPLSPPPLQTELVTSEAALRDLVSSGDSVHLVDEQWEELISVIEGGKGLARPQRQSGQTPRLKPWAQVLAKLDEKVANFDADQRRAAITLVNGPQRIRGIAGSGKTIVLAMKAAHIHLLNPDSRILFTFWTKSLYELIRMQITRFYRQFNDMDPNWEKVQVLHAWGGRNAPGVYFNACVSNGVTPLPLRSVPDARGKSKFESICEHLLKRNDLAQEYDYVLIDEGQDLPASFYRLCFKLCAGEDVDRNVIWAYDELQTIMDVSPQDTEKTFGKLPDGRARIDLERAHETLSDGLVPHDIVLKKSYRNPAEILVTAHALGLGVYGQHPVQILENKEHWSDLGYEVIQGACIAGEDTIISRPKENSPVTISDHVKRSEIVKTYAAADFSDELAWIVADIRVALKNGLKPEEILVISLDDRSARAYFSNLAKRLDAEGVGINNLLDSVYGIPKFYMRDHISTSTVYRAKGNEAPLVYVAGVEALTSFLNDVRTRNRLFTALTRSRGWLRVSGLTPYAEPVLNEIKTALANFPELRFKYPSRDQIRTVQRDLSARAAKLRDFQQLVFELGASDFSEEEIKAVIESAQTKKA